jgi:multiple antibiotic resistance protein
MSGYVGLFVSLFTTLVAIINPLEAIPVYLGLTDGKSDADQRQVARKACFYTLLLGFFFLFFGTALLRVFNVSLSMVRVVGGLVLMRVGFDLFNPPASGGIIPRSGDPNANVAFVPLAMPIMFGPGAIATVISMAATIRRSEDILLHLATAAGAIVACMGTVYLSLIYAKPILRKFGKEGLDATTRIVGFFVATMGMSLIFSGVAEFLGPYRGGG